MKNFESLGLAFEAAGQFDWMNSHAQVPSILEKNDRYRIYFATRPHSKLSMPAYVDLAKKDLKTQLDISEKPIIELGKVGTFDEFGIMPSSVIEVDNKVFLYYTGWSRGTTVPYLNAIGLAISEDGGKSFYKYSEGPIVERSKFEPYSAMSPYVLYENNKFHMWYSSGVDWFKGKEKYEPIYVIKYAHSNNGVDWVQTNQVAIKPMDELEASTRPSVIRLGDKYYMWFCYRGSNDFRGGNDSYRIGFAESKDLTNWTRREPENSPILTPRDESQYDNIMVEYPQIIKKDDELLMFYNGNGFGIDGFSIAKLPTDVLK